MEDGAAVTDRPAVEVVVGEPDIIVFDSRAILDAPVGTAVAGGDDDAAGRPAAVEEADRPAVAGIGEEDAAQAAVWCTGAALRRPRAGGSGAGNADKR